MQSSLHFPLRPFPRGKHTNGAFNIQTVNAYHKDMKKLIQFSGVSTKYLNNYVVYHNFVNFAKGSFSEKLDILKEFVFTTRRFFLYS